MVFVAGLKGTVRCADKVQVLRDSGATRNFIHPSEATRRGLAVYDAPHALQVTLGDGKEVRCGKVARLKLVFHNYVYEGEAYLLDMGKSPDCTVILGTPWLATLGDYVCNEHKGTLSFWRKGGRSHQKVVLTSRGRQAVERERGDLNEMESTFLEARAAMQRAKRKGSQCYRAQFQMGDDFSDASPTGEG